MRTQKDLGHCVLLLGGGGPPEPIRDSWLAGPESVCVTIIPLHTAGNLQVPRETGERYH